MSAPMPALRRVLIRVRAQLALLVATLLTLGLVGLVPAPTASAAAAATPAPASTSTSTSAAAAAAKAASRITIRTASVKKAARRAVENRIMKTAASRKGTPYRYGGTGRGGFDCSGYTRWVFKRFGVNLPHQSGAQVSRTKRTKHPRVGDLVFFTNHGRVYHVAIYAGARKVWHAPYTGAKVRKERIWSGSVFYGRVKGMEKTVKKAAWKIVQKRRAAITRA